MNYRNSLNVAFRRSSSHVFLRDVHALCQNTESAAAFCPSDYRVSFNFLSDRGARVGMYIQHSKENDSDVE